MFERSSMNSKMLSNERGIIYFVDIFRGAAFALLTNDCLKAIPPPLGGNKQIEETGRNNR